MTHVLRELAVPCLALAPVVASAQDPRSDACWRTMREDLEMSRPARLPSRDLIGTRDLMKRTQWTSGPHLLKFEPPDLFHSRGVSTHPRSVRVLKPR
jgi:hypothetical protein